MSDITAVVWDFDGTLVDTRRKNLNVTRALVELVKDGRSADSFPALRSLRAYQRALGSHSDWKDFYRVELEMTDEQLREAGARWMEYQLADQTAAPPYEGIVDVLEALSDLPQGIVSLNARDNIVRFLEQLELDHFFHEVLGYEAVEMDRQKPEPDALLLCIERMTEMRPGRVLFVGDHEVDAQCARAASRHLRERQIEIDIVSVGAFYGIDGDDSGWSARPHVRALDPRDILDLLTSGAPAGDGSGVG